MLLALSLPEKGALTVESHGRSVVVASSKGTTALARLGAEGDDSSEKRKEKGGLFHFP